MNKISPIWKGEVAVCVASGPSLDTDDIAYAKERARIIAINDNYILAPFADVLYACDLQWWDWHKGVPEFAGTRWTQDPVAAEKYSLNYIRGIDSPGLSTDPEILHTGSNSGYQAINLAYLLGAKRIILLGYDMKFSSCGLSHWFGDHPNLVRSNYDRWLSGYQTIADQCLVEVINCTRDTALECFPKSDIRNVL